MTYFQEPYFAIAKEMEVKGDANEQVVTSEWYGCCLCRTKVGGAGGGKVCHVSMRVATIDIGNVCEWI